MNIRVAMSGPPHPTCCIRVDAVLGPPQLGVITFIHVHHDHLLVAGQGRRTEEEKAFAQGSLVEAKIEAAIDFDSKIRN